MGVSQSTDNPSKKLQGASGTALIINHEHFNQPPGGRRLETRHGTRRDEDNLRITLLRRGFNIPDLPRDMTKQQVLQIINHYANGNDVEYPAKSCLVVIVLSHGEKGGKIYSYDSHYFTSDIWKPFTKSQKLNGNPKLFIFQACRGHRDDIKFIHERKNISTLYTMFPQHEAQHINVDEIIKLPELPNNSECFIAYSTVEFRQSKRHIVDGTWYIDTICRELNSIVAPVDLLQFMTRVTSKVIQRRHGSSSGQTPTFVSYLHHSLTIPVDERCSGQENLELDDGIRNDSSENSPDNERSMEELFSNLTEMNINEEFEQNTESCENSEDIPQCKNITKDSGRILIFYAGDQYKRDAKQFEKCIGTVLDSKRRIKNIEMKNMKHENKTDNFQKKLLEVMNDKNKTLADDNFLLIAIFAPIKYETIDNNGLQECYIKMKSQMYPLNLSWSPFLASTCSKLIGKPKLFFFIDPYYDEVEDGVNETIPLPKIVSQVEECNNPSVTEHSDFLFVHGFSRKFVLQLQKTLREGVKNKDDICTIVTKAMAQEREVLPERITSGTKKKSIREYSENTPGTVLPFFESTLQTQIVLCSKAYVVSENKKRQIEMNPEDRIEDTIFKLTILDPIIASLKGKFKANSFLSKFKAKRNDHEHQEAVFEKFQQEKKYKKFKKNTDKLQKNYPCAKENNVKLNNEGERILHEKKQSIKLNAEKRRSNTMWYNIESENQLDVSKLTENMAALEELNNIKKEKKQLEFELNQLKRKLEEEQYKLVIYNVPEYENENLWEIVQKIIEILSISEFKESDIIDIERYRGLNESTSIIIITLERVKIRDSIINQSKSQCILAKNIGFPDSENRIYINAYLNTEKYILFMYTRKQLKKSDNSLYKFVWTNINGDILVRKNHKSGVIKILSRDMVDELAVSRTVK